MENYKSNSDKSKSEEQKKIEPVVTTPAVIKKKNGFSKFAEEFITEDAPKLKDYVVKDVLIPTFKKTISDIITNAIDILLYGGSRDSRRSTINATRYSYASYYDRRPSYEPRPVSRHMNYDDIVFDTRASAEAVIDGLISTIRRYGNATVTDLYDLAGITGQYTDSNYGWTDLRDARVEHCRDGFVLKLPRPMPINDD